MVRRKPQHVQRFRQQQQQEQEADNAAAQSSEDDAPNPPHDLIIIDDSDETETDVDDVPEPPPPSKRPRIGMTRWLRHGERPFFDQRLQLRPAQPSQLSSHHVPWSTAKRQSALWISFPVQESSAVGQKLQQIGSHHTSVGFILVAPDNIAADTLSLRELGENDWQSSLETLLSDDIITMEIDESARWHVGIDWQAYMAQAHDNAVCMRHFMIWVLHHSQEVSIGQWSYKYTDEIDAMYRCELRKDYSASVSFDIHDVYARIDVAAQLQRSVANIPTDKLDGVLLPTLREYQKAAVSWMLSREGVASGGAPSIKLHRAVRFENSAGPTLLYDPLWATFEVEDTSGDTMMTIDLGKIRGGILADEMGLGKTVEVITLVLSHPSPDPLPQLLSDLPDSASSRHKNCICSSDEDEDAGWRECTLCGSLHHRLCTSLPHEDADGESDDSFLCFHCHRDHRLVHSCKTTLIVSPASIHDQWEAELRRHVKPGVLSLLRYPGVKSLRRQLQGRGPSADWAVLASPSAVAAYDIVLTTYEALADDLHHVPTSSGQARRHSTRQHKKKYAFVASPLVFLQCWRICMDEAQVGVENETLKAALTVARLRADHQWIVTGTPFATQLSDLYGCLKFLKVVPYGVVEDGAEDEGGGEYEGRRWFRNELETMYSRGAVEKTMDLLLLGAGDERGRGGGLLWRTRKRDVVDQLQLPEQTQEVVWCRFSEVERVFYDRQKEELLKALRREEEARRRQRQALGVQQADDEDEEVTGSVWHRLLTLRQVCCHPGVGQTLQNNALGGPGGAGRRLGGAAPDDGGVLTMDDFLERLVVKSRKDCEDAQRQLLAALNGQAAVALLQRDVPSAVLKYLVAVEVIRRNWLAFRADLLPRLHILEHLAASVRRHYQIPSSAQARGGEGGSISENPRNASLMPELTALRRAVTSTGLLPLEDVDLPSIASECDTLDANAAAIRRFYVQLEEHSHSSALIQFDTLRSEVDDAMADTKLLCASSSWWLNLLQLLRRDPSSSSSSMIDRLRAHLYSQGTNWSGAFADRFHDVHGLSLALVQELQTLASTRARTIKKLRAMSGAVPSAEEIHVSGNCRKCRDARDGVVCPHCRFYKELEGYRQHLLGIDAVGSYSSTSSSSWTVDTANVGEEGSSSSTTASTSLVLDVLRQLASGVRALLLREPHRLGLSKAEGTRMAEEIQSGVQQDNELFASLLREWTKAKHLFQAQHRRLGALDELSMAKMQLRLRAPGEKLRNASEKQYILEPAALPSKALALEAERVVAENDLQSKHSQLKYLQHLQDKKTHQSGAEGEQGSSGERDTERRSACVVCLEDMTKLTVAVLPCAHMTCESCSARIAQRSQATRSVRCPTCRRVFAVSERKFLLPEEEQQRLVRQVSSSPVPSHPLAADQLRPLVKGGFGSKIDAVLRRVRALAVEQPQLKALVFTQWIDMMLLVTRALTMNGLRCLRYTGKRQFAGMLNRFKHSSEPCVFVLPFSVGANGVNIVEATEVLLLEPLLNTSIELQAINRVHRIGQTRVTKVHRFVVENSVEERIIELGGGHRRVVAEREDETGGDGEAMELEEEEEKEEEESLVVGRQEREKLTLAQLHVLLNMERQPAIAASG